MLHLPEKADLDLLAARQQQTDATVTGLTANVTAHGTDIAKLRADLQAALERIAALEQPPDPPQTTGLPFFGAAVGGNSDPAPLETQAGRVLGVRRHYWNDGQTASSLAMCAADVAAGRVPWPSYKIGVSWAEAAAGARDSWFAELCQDLNALGGPVMLTVHHEPEGDGPIGDWVAMQARLAPIAKPFPNVKFGPIVTGWTVLYGNEQYRLDAMWPDGPSPDFGFFGYDAYNYWGRNSGDKWVELDVYHQALGGWAQSHGLPWAVGEFGMTDNAGDQDAEWIARAYDDAVTLGGCLALAYFDSNLNSPNNPDWDLEDHPAKLAAYVATLQRSIPAGLTAWP